MNTIDHRLAPAFTEWHRRWVEEPARFLSESATLATPGATYGENCAAYLMAIIGDLRLSDGLPAPVSSRDGKTTAIAWAGELWSLDERVTANVQGSPVPIVYGKP